MKDISHKEEYVKEFQQKLEKAGVIILADCEGVTVSEMTELRRAVRQTKSELRVVKNTLVARALH
ncbi:MAG: 50S ribosomal protein L10, partial [Candidatus Riflebacteria bacterium]